MNKVPGEDNCADLITKHIGAKLVDGNIGRMQMNFELGQAAKAVSPHTVSVARDQHNNNDDGDDNDYDVEGFLGLAICAQVGERSARGRSLEIARRRRHLTPVAHVAPAVALHTLRGGEGASQ